MKSIVSAVCVLFVCQITAARLVPGNAFIPDSQRVCAEETYDRVKDMALSYIGQLQTNVQEIRTVYDGCQTSSNEGACLNTFSELVVQYVTGLAAQFETNRATIRAYALERLDDYFNCRSMRIDYRSTMLNTRNELQCAADLLAEAQVSYATIIQRAFAYYEQLRASFLGCRDGAEANAAVCYATLIDNTIEIAYGILEELRNARESLLETAVVLLDNYYVCRLD